ncbi:hypothetical protein SAMN05192550_0350 [Flavobacterium glycines]|uniref:DUF4199 domain-containing protein n=1 Tax=Flavobacterium glycines TaxID=551990 RepID=A0A1B9DPG3_9FLAO|nr:hypothetical protein [Flavobacterium glycines]OCB71577.1 hypothetical protein FBGL_10090 [Flavobacterium glycines]GEL10610.1 hypothetical protein FGL01_13490 [Flavobacterium glycines]SDI61358.1 hypothetical protein SAMN05192550_0350 [Flavobacterium glycines]
MKLPKEFYNGVIIFTGIALYFLLMEALHLSNVYFLRLFNIIFVYYGVNRTLKSNFAEGKTNLPDNAISALTTSLTGVFLSISGLVAYIYAKGGDSYIKTLSDSLLFVGSPSVMTYNISLLFEGIVSAVIVTFSLMLFWKKKYPTD